jgi:hypothetical protein
LSEGTNLNITSICTNQIPTKYTQEESEVIKKGEKVGKKGGRKEERKIG